MSYTKRYKLRIFSTPQPKRSDEVEVVDERVAFEIKTVGELNRFRLTNKIMPVISFPLSYDKELGVFKLGTSPNFDLLSVNGTPQTPADWTQYFQKIDKIAEALGTSVSSYTDAAGAYTLRWYLAYIVNTRLTTNNTLLTTTPLAAGETYESSWLNLSTMWSSYLVALVYSDQDGTLYVQQSWDGSNVHREDSLSYTGGSTSGNMLKVQLMARYVRIKYVNGSADQSVFALGFRLTPA